MPDVKTRQYVRTQIRSSPVFRHPSPLLPDEEDHLLELAQRTFDTFLAVAGSGATREARSVCYHDSATVAADLSEVESVLANLTDVHITDAMDGYAGGLLGSTILHVVASTPEMHVVVRWFACECSALVHHRDFCVLEMQKHLTLPSGHKAWALAQHSVRIPSCPDLKHALNFVRGSLYHSGVLVSETDTPGRLDVYQRFEFDLKGTAPRWLAKHTIKAAALDFTKIEAHIRDLRRQETALSTFQSMTPTETCAECSLCATKFHVLMKKINCHLCGQVVCSKCHSAKRQGCVACIEDPFDMVDDLTASSSRRDYAPALAMESSKSMLDAMTSSLRSEDLTPDLADFTLSTTYLTASGVSTSRLSDSTRTLDLKHTLATEPHELAIEPRASFRHTWLGKKLLR
ncbi:hypothetical protein SPRG_13844 [Saprolegnia parasitica CBS 223.65]|uniref:START domain-containing protein n=1 Tax=Saprolegnia parasitica (strain CBS 223.65) TaxID=695850 RepID=A0A067C2M1_SAPPC|nr:hypothetical protein SPRG_13844 [Saprolegnia parasitica CBS 223.65]KDO21052.1 hypothetical protein SPRG_13844 [Saprolegnia parasitica CBS 223.65]|eukprot:XP_012208231.1 hypothetical protein SPRG_13844 [Saprolegnia parasitica CBS 223.65]